MKIAIVTGGSRGLGKSSSLHLAKKGVGVILTYHSNKTEAEAVVKEVEALGSKAVAIQLDVSKSETFEKFASDVRSALKIKFGREDFDYLLNNAGTALYAPFAETSEAQFMEVMNVHLKGPFFLTQKLLPTIKNGGKILNVSSGLARFSLPGSSAYAMMKGGVEVMTRYLAKELGARQISVNTIAPGAIETDFGNGHVRDNKDLNATISSMTALGRVGLPDDIGGAVAALLSDDTNWINAQRIEASGGTLI